VATREFAAISSSGELAELIPVVNHIVSEEQLELMRILGQVCCALLFGLCRVKPCSILAQAFVKELAEEFKLARAVSSPKNDPGGSTFSQPSDGLE
jgi:hypothetical protein